MSKVRRCDKRCHSARGTRCKCWCEGFYHGKDGDVNRETLKDAARYIEEHGAKPGEVYLDQLRLPE